MLVTEVKGRQSKTSTVKEEDVVVARPVITLNVKDVEARAAVVSILNEPLELRVTALVEPESV